MEDTIKWWLIWIVGIFITNSIFSFDRCGLLHLTNFSFPNLMGAFGQYDVLLEAERIFANNYNDGYTYILDNISAFTGPLVVVIGITLFVALVFFLFFIINSFQGYVTFQKVLPDADLNIVGGASRTMGRTLEKVCYPGD